MWSPEQRSSLLLEAERGCRAAFSPQTENREIKLILSVSFALSSLPRLWRYYPARAFVNGNLRNIDCWNTAGYKPDSHPQPCQFIPQIHKLCMQYMFTQSVLIIHWCPASFLWVLSVYTLQRLAQSSGHKTLLENISDEPVCTWRAKAHMTSRSYGLQSDSTVCSSEKLSADVAAHCEIHKIPNLFSSGCNPSDQI